MQHTPAQYLKARSFSGVYTVECYGEVWSRSALTVRFEVAAPGAPVVATVNGQPADLEAALTMAHGLTGRTVSEEWADRPAPAPIGKARARRLHILMARAGVASGQHYTEAARALGRGVASLAALTEGEARRVWAHLCRAYPAAAGAA